MSVTKQLLLGLVVCVLMFAAGYYAGAGQVEVREVETVRTVQGEKQVEFRDRILTVTRTVKPDGTTTEVTRTEEKQKSSSEKVVSSDKSTEREVSPALAKYSLGAGLAREVSMSSLKPELGTYYISAGMRALGPVWLDTQYSPNLNEIRVGFRVEL